MDVRKDHKRLLDNMLLLQRVYSAKALSASIGINPATWSRRIKEPWRMFSYDDFRSIAKYCGINFAELMEGELSI